MSDGSELEVLQAQLKCWKKCLRFYKTIEALHIEPSNFLELVEEIGIQTILQSAPERVLKFCVRHGIKLNTLRGLCSIYRGVMFDGGAIRTHRDLLAAIESLTPHIEFLESKRALKHLE